jgi:hypothetical protein
MTYAGPQTNIVFVPVPVGASTDWGREPKPPRYPQKPKSGTWRPATGIPDRAARREAVRQLLEQTRPHREAALDKAKAMLGHGKLAA